MYYKKQDPPVIKRRRICGENNRSYAALMDAVRDAAGQWLAVPLSEITGGTKVKKQVNILQAARIRRMRVQTSVQGESVYVRLIMDSPETAVRS